MRLDVDVRRKGDVDRVRRKLDELLRDHLGVHAIPVARARSTRGGEIMYQTPVELEREAAVAAMREMLGAVETDRRLVDCVDQLRLVLHLDGGILGFGEQDYRGEMRDWHLETLGEGRS